MSTPIFPVFPPMPAAVAVNTVYTVVDSLGEVACVLRAEHVQQLTANTPPGGEAVAGVPPTANLGDCYRAAGAWVKKPAQPTAFHRWDATAKSWVESRTFVEVKLFKWVDIKTSRDAAINAPFSTPYGVFDGDEKAQASITKAVLLAQTLTSMAQPVAIAFTLANNSVMTLDLNAIITVGLLLGQKEQAARATGTTLRARIEAALSAAELDAIKWPVT